MQDATENCPGRGGHFWSYPIENGEDRKSNRSRKYQASLRQGERIEDRGMLHSNLLDLKQL